MNSTIAENNKCRHIETRESQLWWLAVLVIVLMALALFVIDMTNATSTWSVIPQLELALNTRFMRAGLILATLLICAYFRDSSRRLRHENTELIMNLEAYGRLLEKKNREISRLKDLSDQLIGMTNLNDALDLVLGIAVDMIGADTASIMLRGRNDNILRIIASRGLSSSVVKSTRIEVGASIAGLVAKNGKGIIIDSSNLSADIADRAHRGKTIASSVVVPIQVGDEVRGVVNVAKRWGSGCFNDEDLGVLSTLANQASLVIQKTQLLDDLRNQVAILASTVEELRQTQAGLIQSEKLASIGQLAGGVAHEINNPLQIILGRIELLVSQEHDPANVSTLKLMLEQTTRIASIVSNLLSFSRQSSDSEFRPLDVNDVLDKTLNLLEPQMAPDDITIIRDPEEGLGMVFGNPGMLQQVFTNITLNAYHAMRDMGHGTLTVQTRADADKIDIEFIDTGPGIASEHIERLFEPFFTTKAEGEGTGLGLSIAYGIVQSHGGTIQAINDPKGGARFSIALPLAPVDQNRQIEKRQFSSEALRHVEKS